MMCSCSPGMPGWQRSSGGGAGVVFGDVLLFGMVEVPGVLQRGGKGSASCRGGYGVYLLGHDQREGVGVCSKDGVLQHLALPQEEISREAFTHGE